MRRTRPPTIARWGLAAPSLVAVLLVSLPFVATDAGAQGVGRLEGQRPPLPSFEAPQAPILPPSPLAAPMQRPGAAPAPVPGLVVRGFRVVGCTVFTEEELRELLAPYNGREITSEDLVEIRDTLTRHYVDAGYVNSGALIPDQDPTDGIVEIHVVEGRLAGVQLEGQRHFREGPLRARIASGLTAPLDLNALETNLQLLQQDPRIERVHAKLLPTERRGEALLLVRIEENSPYHVDLQGSNYAPVAFGGYRGQVTLGDDNLLGLGDTLEARYVGAEGLQRGGLRYEIPLNARGTLFQASGEYSRARVVEEPFDILDIRTDYYAARAGLVQPLYRSLHTQVSTGLFFEWRKAKTCLEALKDLVGCDTFDFVFAGSTGGDATVSALRFELDWQRVDQNQALAARSVLSFGLPVLGAASGGVVPDGKFVAWLGQIQWARRFEPWGIQAIFRTDLQFTNDSVPTLERIPVGGHASVRGYRENQLVRDEAVISSLELRVPLWRVEGRSIVEVAPFFDFGYAHDKERETPPPKTIASTGVGLRIYPHPSLEMQLYWGHQLDDVLTPGGDLQDDGVQFRVDWRPF